MRLSAARIVIVLAVAAMVMFFADRLTRDALDAPLALQSSTGASIDPFDHSGRATVFIFARSDCPVSNRYAPEVRRLCEEFTPQGVRFWLVYPDPQFTADSMREHIGEYDYPCEGLLDPRHELVERCGAQITPEAAVFTANGAFVYRGRIDDRQVAFGVARAEPSVRDLEDVLTAVLDGDKVAFRSTTAVGCFIADLKR